MSGLRLRAVLVAMRLGPLAFLILLIGLFAASSEPFRSWQTAENIMVQVTPVALIAIGALVVILARGLDLSVGASVTLATLVGALVGRDISGNPVIVILAMVLCGTLVGAINATLIVGTKIDNPIVVTLGTWTALRGVSATISDDQPISGIPDSVQALGVGEVLGVPTQFVIVLVFALVVFGFLRYTQWGRWIYAIGGDPDSADRLGIPRRKVVVTCYLLGGAAAGLAAVIIAARFGVGSPDAGTGLELDALAAVVIGGASFYGGRGGVSAPLVGALVITVMYSGLNVIGVDPTWQLVASGAILVSAVALDKISRTVEQRVRSAAGRIAEEAPEHDATSLLGHTEVAR